MKNRPVNKTVVPDPEFIPVELRRITEEEFERWDEEPCIASAD
jgi:hypothetical protein